MSTKSDTSISTSSENMYDDDMDSYDGVESCDESLPTKFGTCPLGNIDYMIENLTKDELERAARSSFEYQKNPDPSTKEFHATEMAKRYIDSKPDKVLALMKLKDTLSYRKSMDLDDMETMTRMNRTELHKFLTDKKAYVQGYDIDGRSTYIFTPRLVTDHKDCARTLRGHVWSLEKAIACTRSQDQTINIIIDFSGFSMYSHSPPFKVGKELMTTLRKHYVGRINRIYLVDVPSTFSILWSLFSPFIGSKTKNKIIFVAKDTDTIMSSYYTKDQSTPWMHPEGQKQRQLDVDEYLNKLPFNKSFDDK